MSAIKIMLMDFASKNKFGTFAKDDSYEPTALAYDSGKPIVLSGKAAEDFEKRMLEVERQAEYRKAHPRKKTLQELENELSINKMILSSEEEIVSNRKKKISKLEEEINSLNGEIEQEK